MISEVGMASIPGQEGPGQSWAQHVIIIRALQMSEEPAASLRLE